MGMSADWLPRPTSKTSLPILLASSLLVVLLALLPPTSAHLPQERDYSLVVDAGKEECFFEEVVKGNTLTVEYQVIDGGDEMTSELDINFKLLSPRGHPLVAEFKKSDGTHSHHIEEQGDYKICFDNTFSYLSSKTVYFEILNENEDEDYDELRDIFGDDEEVDAEYYEVSVAEIEVKLKKIKDDIAKAKHQQDLIRITDLKDRSIMEHNFERVNLMSIFYVVFILVAGIGQVLLLRSLFDEKSKINPLWKKAFND